MNKTCYAIVREQMKYRLCQIENEDFAFDCDCDECGALDKMASDLVVGALLKITRKGPMKFSVESIRHD